MEVGLCFGLLTLFFAFFPTESLPSFPGLFYTFLFSLSHFLLFSFFFFSFFSFQSQSDSIFSSSSYAGDRLSQIHLYTHTHTSNRRSSTDNITALFALLLLRLSLCVTIAVPHSSDGLCSCYHPIHPSIRPFIDSLSKVFFLPFFFHFFSFCSSLFLSLSSSLKLNSI